MMSIYDKFSTMEIQMEIFEGLNDSKHFPIGSGIILLGMLFNLWLKYSTTGWKLVSVVNFIEVWNQVL